MTNTEKIREACIKANPEILEKECPCNGWKYQKRTECDDCKGNKGLIPREIRLADVLLMIEGIDFDTDKERKDVMAELSWGHWILSQDNLENQSKETIDFITGLL